MPAWAEDSTSRDDVVAQLSGSAGVANFPNGAVPANGVSIAEVLRYIHGALSGTATGENGITTFPAAAAAANTVSIAEVIRYMSENQLRRIASKVIAAAGTSFTTGLSPVSLFTVTGDVLARVFATVQTGLTSTSTNGTLAIGVTGNTGAFIGATTADGTNFPTGAVWAGDTSPTVKAEALSSAALNYCIIAGGADILATIATNSMTAGAITFYCEYVPLSSDGAVAAA